ncbi:MAG TPA: PAS domain S-box protein [Cyclobacteriaceae bacterium]|nr:PAS domain S-box protein [Cyclobacteriaceae bacterium]
MKESKGNTENTTGAQVRTERREGTIDGFYRRMIGEVKDYAIIGLDPDGRVVEWNRGAEKIKGYKSSEIIGQNFRVFYTEEDRAKGLPDNLMNQAKKEGSVTSEGWRLKKDGGRFWASVVMTAIRNPEGELIGFSKVTRDLTERKRAEDALRTYAEELEVKNEELRLSEERYHKMISEVQDYAIILLSKNGDIEDWNAGAQFIKGYTAPEIIGKNFRLFYTEEDREKKVPEMLIDLATQNGRAQHEGWRVRKDGTKFWGSVTISAIHGNHDNVIGFTKVTRDLTEKKIAEDNLKRKNVELEEMNKELNTMNKELSSFAYISSHDLQEPLRKIQTFSSRIMEVDEGKLSQKGIDYFNRIQNAAQRMRLLIDDLLSYSRANTAERKYEKTDLNKIIKDVLEDLENIIDEKKAVVECGSMPVMDVIPFQFHQLLLNLLSNSLKFIRPNSTPYILIRSSTVPANKVPGLQKKVSELYHHISVADNGIGFNQDYSQRIFDVFQRLHGREEYPGTGIGLAICKKIVENHYGTIAAEAKPGSGATFHIYIPMELPTYAQTETT